MLFKRFLLCILLALLFLVPSLSASAHVLKTDGTIGAVLHIDPDDDPIAGQQSNFFFEFKDKTGKLNLNNCLCIASIREEGKEISSSPLQADSSGHSGILSFTFPQKDVYQVVVTGKPNDSSFQPFTLSYDIRVDRSSSNSSSTKPQNQSFFLSHLIYFLGAIVVISLFEFSFWKTRQRR